MSRLTAPDGPEQDRRVPAIALVLGAAGLLPPLAAMWLIVLSGDPFQGVAMFTAVFAYSALIFSFVGGTWWGFAVRDPDGPQWADMVAAVSPSLAAFFCLPLVGAIGPNGAFALAALVLASPLVDLRFQRRGLAPIWWMRLRLPLSAGLATLLSGAVLLVP